VKDILQDKTFCIVGNGPCEKGTGNGPKIDEFDIVFRFNNFVLGGHELDYGEKTTHWVMNFYRDITAFGRNKEFDMICPLPLNTNKYLGVYKGTHKANLSKYSDKTKFIDVGVFEDLRIKIPTPSTGMCLIWWIYKSGLAITKDQIFGFSNFSERHYHYFDTMKDTVHNGASEKALIDKITK